MDDDVTDSLQYQRGGEVWHGQNRLWSDGANGCLDVCLGLTMPPNILACVPVCYRLTSMYAYC